MNLKQAVRTTSLFTLAAVSGTLLSAAPKPADDAKKSAEQWLALVDAGKFSESWETLVGVVKTAVPKLKWEAGLTKYHNSFGDVVSRKLKSAKSTKSIPGAPDGEYVVLQFDTTFANKKSAIETVAPMLDQDGKWRISGYLIE